MNKLLWLALCCLLAPAPGWALTDYTARVVKKLPHSRNDFVQGLEIHAGKLYQGTGGYGTSQLQIFDLASGVLLQHKELPRQLFGEGITLLKDRIVQLTWHAGRGLVYRADDLQLLEEFALPGEGWGLTNNGEQLIYSDGSDQLHFVSPDDWKITHSISVRMQGRPVPLLNELEWTPDYLLANVWGRDWILMIDLDSGEVTGRIDLAGLLPRQQRDRSTDVLNGIARDPVSGALWVTGKNWPWLYQIELQQKNALE